MIGRTGNGMNEGYSQKVNEKFFVVCVINQALKMLSIFVRLSFDQQTKVSNLFLFSVPDWNCEKPLNLKLEIKIETEFGISHSRSAQTNRKTKLLRRFVKVIPHFYAI